MYELQLTEITKVGDQKKKNVPLQDRQTRDQSEDPRNSQKRENPTLILEIHRTRERAR